MNRLSEEFKIDIGLEAQAMSGTFAIGPFFDMSGSHRALGILNIASMGATETGTIEFLQATDAAGSNAKGIPDDDNQKAKATITANTLVTEATIALATVANTDIVEINGISFTKAATTEATERKFADAAGLVTCITDSTYGVPGVTASASGTTVTVKADNPGSEVITLGKTEKVGTITLATTKAQAYVEIENMDLDHENGFTHIAEKISATGSTVVSGTLIRGTMRDPIVQKVGEGTLV
jgi:hypothetical protein